MSSGSLTRKGHAYLRNIDADFTFSPSALEQPQAHVFWPLLSGKKDQVIQEASGERLTISISNMLALPV